RQPFAVQPAGNAAHASHLAISCEVRPFPLAVQPPGRSRYGIVVVMAGRPLVATAALAGAAVSALTGAPTAAASGADATIAELQSEGYIVQINWLNGASVSLPLCTV